MNKQELLDKLYECVRDSQDDAEAPHARADALLLQYIDDVDIAMVYMTIKRWYS